MISSAIPSVKYSFSASALMLVKGRTAIDFAVETTGCGIVWVSLGVCRLFEASAWANSPAVRNRAVESVDIALLSAFSTFSGTVLRTERIDLGGSVNRFARIA